MIVYACADLIFATKIGSTAQALGVPARPARNAEMLRSRLDRVDDGRANDAVTCFMVDLDLGDTAIELIGEAAAHEPPIQIVAFGPHVMTQALRQAAEAGAGTVMTRGAFTSKLVDLIQGDHSW